MDKLSLCVLVLGAVSISVSSAQDCYDCQYFEAADPGTALIMSFIDLSDVENDENCRGDETWRLDHATCDSASADHVMKCSVINGTVTATVDTQLGEQTLNIYGVFRGCIEEEDTISNGCYDDLSTSALGQLTDTILELGGGSPVTNIDFVGEACYTDTSDIPDILEANTPPSTTVELPSNTGSGESEEETTHLECYLCQYFEADNDHTDGLLSLVDLTDIENNTYCRENSWDASQVSREICEQPREGHVMKCASIDGTVDATVQIPFFGLQTLSIYGVFRGCIEVEDDASNDCYDDLSDAAESYLRASVEELGDVIVTDIDFDGEACFVDSDLATDVTFEEYRGDTSGSGLVQMSFSMMSIAVLCGLTLRKP